MQALNRRFRDAPPEALLAWAAAEFGDRAALTCSFGGAAGMVLLDMIARQRLPIAVLFLDTDLLFPETYALAAEVERRYGLPVIRQRPALSLETQARQHGPELYARDPDRCCALRKVAPLAEALRPYQAWISGIRREQTAQRAATEPVAWNAKYGLLKLSPLATWSARQVWAYLHALNERLITTYAACGDVARNVMTCPVADLLPGHTYNLQAIAQQINDRFLPESTAYYELWFSRQPSMQLRRTTPQ